MPTRKEIEHHLTSKLGRDIKHYLLMEDIYEKPGNEDQPHAAIYRLAKISTKLIDNELIPDDYLIGLKSILDEEQLEPWQESAFLDHLRFCEAVNNKYKQTTEELLSTSQLVESVHQTISSFHTNSDMLSTMAGDAMDKCHEKLIGLRERLIKLIRENLLPRKQRAELMSSLDEVIDSLAYARAEREKKIGIDREIQAIQHGIYQALVTKFTSYTPKSENQFFGKNIVDHSIKKSIDVVGYDKKKYVVFPILNEPGVRCTAAIQKYPASGPIEIQINFFGTRDFASEIVDMDEGGPGQEAIKKYETSLVQQINSLVHQMSLKNPNQPIRLRIAGHSLGGALAKCFTHSLQRALAVQKDSPENIIKEIRQELGPQADDVMIQRNMAELKIKLGRDANRFSNLSALKKIEGITVYSVGGPGVSAEMDKHATLLTYYSEPDFLHVYNHFHKEDIIPKFGECEFLSGEHGSPRVLINKSLQYYIPVDPIQARNTPSLPFPGITSFVMVAHNLPIFPSKDVEHKISELKDTKMLLDKFVFSRIQKAVYAAVFQFAKFLASFKVLVKICPILYTMPRSNIEKPDLLSDEVKVAAATKLQSRFREKLAERDINTQSEQGTKPSPKKPI